MILNARSSSLIEKASDLNYIREFDANFKIQ